MLNGSHLFLVIAEGKRNLKYSLLLSRLYAQEGLNRTKSVVVKKGVKFVFQLKNHKRNIKINFFPSESRRVSILKHLILSCYYSLITLTSIMFKSLLRSSSIPLRTFAKPTTVTTVSPSSLLRAFTTTAPHHYKADKNSHAYKYLHEKTPIETKFTEEHEYVKLYDDDSALIGITQYAAQALGDVTFVELPELGTRVEIGETLGSVESVKSASEIYSPVSGEVVGVNNVLESEPGLLNHDPTIEGWIAHIKLDDPKQITESETLLTTEDYAKSLEED